MVLGARKVRIAVLGWEPACSLVEVLSGCVCVWAVRRSQAGRGRAAAHGHRQGCNWRSAAHRERGKPGGAALLWQDPTYISSFKPSIQLPALA